MMLWRCHFESHSAPLQPRVIIISKTSIVNTVNVPKASFGCCKRNKLIKHVLSKPLQRELVKEQEDSKPKKFDLFKQSVVDNSII